MSEATLNSICQRKSCQDEIQQLRNQIAEHENEIRTKKEVYRRALIRNFGLDCSIEDLEDQVTKTDNYKEYEGRISHKTILLLESFTLLKGDDCKFITAVLRDIFSENIYVLKNMTATGRGVEKTAIPVEKYEIIEQIYNTRMLHAGKHDSEVIERKKNLNKNLKSAIETINKSN